ncbi:aprataxin and PNK-like factor isoform X2 [Mixophyes fleayi]|uniref:aprataxin and PNK-like factor isoform X2 n=1 Tax=Mixophyes fleayi TaxID=3061075 RepID=UPI003F4E06C5
MLYLRWWMTSSALNRNSKALDEDCALNNNITCSPIASGTKVASEEPSSPVRDKSKPTPSPPSATCNMGENEKFDNSTSAICCKDDVEQSGPVPRKRVLPSWMLLGDLPTQSLPSPVIKAGKKKRKIPERNISPIKTVQSPMEKKQTPTITLNDEESSLKKKNCDVQSEVLPGTSFGCLPGTASSHMFNAMDNEEEDMDVENCDNTPDLSPPIQTSGKTSPPAKQHKPSNSKGTSNDDLSLSPGSPQASQRRTPCMYGEKCYRKNPTHFQEFSHPGDSDFVENESQDDSDDRPECPYGTDCYRKNPQHKLEYKHTKPPAKSVLDDDSDNDGKPNEYNLEDSFIDDEEDFENTDEDSDWMPESEEKDSEDMKQLLKEAKRFVRGKR